jgi:thiol-disulfide isomerase/thioredoxin
MRQALALLIAVLSASACDQPTPPSGASPTASAAARRVEIVPVAQEVSDARTLIRTERERATREGRELIVYVGAPWCEPCQRFHDAAAKGELDQRFPTLRLVEFDRDRHEAALREAGCLSELIPLFAKPTEDGRCSDTRVQGGIKGDGAVGFIVPRLEKMMKM